MKIIKHLSQVYSIFIDFGTAITADEGNLPVKPGETRLQLPGVEEEGWGEPDYKEPTKEKNHQVMFDWYRFCHTPVSYVHVLQAVSFYSLWSWIFCVSIKCFHWEPSSPTFLCFRLQDVLNGLRIKIAKQEKQYRYQKLTCTENNYCKESIGSIDTHWLQGKFQICLTIRDSVQTFLISYNFFFLVGMKTSS